jgi:hypothetical protein
LREEPKDSSVQHAAPKYDTFFWHKTDQFELKMK